MKFKDTKYGDLTGQTYDGNIDVSGLSLTSLEGAPEIVNGTFSCSNNKLTSLKYAPKKTEIFYCRNNRLESIENAPDVDLYFDCSQNNLKSLKGAPKKTAAFYCSDNQLTDLTHSPKTVLGEFYCNKNNLVSLKGCPETINGTLKLHYNKLETLKYVGEYVGYVDAEHNPNPYLEIEWEVREENPDLTEEEIFAIMYEKTGYPSYLDKNIRDVFFF